MTDPERHHRLMGVLVHTARAHHEATGGPNPRWAEWYAEHAIDDINELLQGDMTASELAEWLAAADQRYISEKPDESWPRAYATWLLDPPQPESVTGV